MEYGFCPTAQGILPRRMRGLRSEDLDKVSLHVADWTRGEIFAAFEATDLVTARRNDAINRIVITNDALENE